MTAMHGPLFVEVKDGCGSKPRKPTTAELAAHHNLKAKIIVARKKVKQAEAELEKLEKLCPCTVSQDTAGWPYDIRNCATCGSGQGLV